jgi:hypothetical protein
VDIDPCSDFCHGLLCSSYISLGPGRITSGGSDSEISIGHSHIQANDIRALTHTVWRSANLCKVHEGFLIDRVDVTLEGTTVLIEFGSKLKYEACSTKLLVRIIFCCSRCEVAKATPIVGPVLNFIGNSSDWIAVWR